MDKRIIKFTSPYVKGDKGGYYWPEYNENDQLVWQPSEADMPIIAPFDVKGEDGGYYTPNIDEAGELNWVPSNNKMPAVEGASLATKHYVDEAVSAIPQPDLSDYALKTDIPDVSNFATKAEIPSLEGYALKTDIPDTSGLATKEEIPDVSGFTTMSAVEAKGYQTEAQVLAIVEENGGGNVFVGAGMPSVSAEVVEGSTGWTAVEITNEAVLLTKLTKGAGDYYIGTDNGGAFGKFCYGSMTSTSLDSPHLGAMASNYGLTATGSYSTGYNWIKISYSTGDAGKEGLVPAPTAGTQDKMWLNSSGEWRIKMPMAGTGVNSEIYNDTRNIATGTYSHAEGVWVEVGGYGSHAEGINTTADGKGSHAEGIPYNWSSNNSQRQSGPQASGYGCHAEGQGHNRAYGNGCHTEGYHETDGRTNGNGAHLEGYSANIYVQASGNGAHVEGYNSTTDSTNANGIHVEGGYSYGQTPYQHVQGKYCIKDVDGTYADIVGNGTADNDTDRANAYTLDWSGNATFAGTITSATGADYAEYFEWLDGNPEEEDRVGYIVKLNGNKIEFANADDDILGIISGTMTVLGDNAEWYWQGKYLTDDFGRIIYEDKAEKAIEINPETGEEEEVVVAIFPAPKLNPNYDADMPYENRKVRPEWDAVGMMGKLFVRDDGTAQVNGYVTANNGIATASGTRTNMRVMERVSENIIRVCLK